MKKYNIAFLLWSVVVVLLTSLRASDLKDIDTSTPEDYQTFLKRNIGIHSDVIERLEGASTPVQHNMIKVCHYIAQCPNGHDDDYNGTLYESSFSDTERLNNVLQYMKGLNQYQCWCWRSIFYGIGALYRISPKALAHSVQAFQKFIPGRYWRGDEFTELINTFADYEAQTVQASLQAFDQHIHTHISQESKWSASGYVEIFKALGAMQTDAILAVAQAFDGFVQETSYTPESAAFYLKVLSKGPVDKVSHTPDIAHRLFQNQGWDGHDYGQAIEELGFPLLKPLGIVAKDLLLRAHKKREPYIVIRFIHNNLVPIPEQKRVGVVTAILPFLEQKVSWHFIKETMEAFGQVDEQYLSSVKNILYILFMRHKQLASYGDYIIDILKQCNQERLDVAITAFIDIFNSKSLMRYNLIKDLSIVAPEKFYAIAHILKKHFSSMCWNYRDYSPIIKALNEVDVDRLEVMEEILGVVAKAGVLDKNTYESVITQLSRLDPKRLQASLDIFEIVYAGNNDDKTQKGFSGIDLLELIGALDSDKLKHTIHALNMIYERESAHEKWDEPVCIEFIHSMTSLEVETIQSMLQILALIPSACHWDLRDYVFFIKMVHQLRCGTLNRFLEPMKRFFHVCSWDAYEYREAFEMLAGIDAERFDPMIDSMFIMSQGKSWTIYEYKYALHHLSNVALERLSGTARVCAHIPKNTYWNTYYYEPVINTLNAVSDEQFDLIAEETARVSQGRKDWLAGDFIHFIKELQNNCMGVRPLVPVCA